MRLLILCLFLANASTLFSQTVANRKVLSGEEVEQLWKDQQELGDLYKRTAASRFVIVGISSKTELIDERGAQQGRIDDNVAGALYTVEVEDTICKQEDFPLETRPNPNSVAQVVHLFVPIRPPVEGIQRKESLSQGGRYLLFLTLPDQKQQNTWKKRFTLDPNGMYYRGEEFARGVIPLTKPTHKDPAPKQPAVLDKVVQLCQAVGKRDRSEKITALNLLATSPDPILKKEALEALRAVQLSPE